MPPNPTEQPSPEAYESVVLSDSERHELYERLPEPQAAMIGSLRTDTLSTGARVRSLCVGVFHSQLRDADKAAWMISSVYRKARKIRRAE